MSSRIGHREEKSLAKSKKLRIDRTAQLENANKSLEQLQKQLKALRKKAKTRHALANHLVGFYNEIDKLAKGRTMVEATPLVVDQINDIIRDSKQIVENDVHLDRVKEFVPAGNNPFYPDVLVTARVVRQSLHRCGESLEKKEAQLLSTLTKVKTVIGALECYLSDDENSEFALKQDVTRYVVGGVEDSCFYWHEFDDGRELLFDFDTLGSQGLEKYLKPDEDDESVDAEDSEEEQD
jgi:hypothetical protein